MDRFLLFSGECCYPSGGWGDYKGSYPTLAEAVEAGRLRRYNPRDDWFQVVSADLLSVVYAIYD